MRDSTLSQFQAAMCPEAGLGVTFQELVERWVQVERLIVHRLPDQAGNAQEVQISFQKGFNSHFVRRIHDTRGILPR